MNSIADLLSGIFDAAVIAGVAALVCGHHSVDWPNPFKRGSKPQGRA